MAKYTILGMMREEVVTNHSVMISVAFRDNETDEDDYFMCSLYAEQMQSPQGFQYDLCGYAEQVAGSELAYQLKRYLQTKANPWSGTMKVETLDYVTDEHFLWSEVISKDTMMPTFKKVTKKKISFTGPYDHGGPIVPGKINYGAPRDVNSLPGLDVQVNHPGEICDAYSYGARLKTMIIHLNDQHKWTREKIADWLDEISDPTGETGPDLRFGAESAKATESEFKSLGWTNHYHHVHLNLEEFYTKDTEAYSMSKPNEMHMHIELKDVSPEIIKLMTGESNEQD